MPKQADNNAGRTPNLMMRRRTLALIVCGIVAFLILAGRLFQLQIIDHELYESKAIEQQLREVTVTAERGTIYDRNMNILAMSASVDTIYVCPIEMNRYDEDPELIADGLSRILGVDKDKVLELLSESNRWYQVVARKVESDLADEVREFINDNELKGIKMETDTKRYYPYSSLAAHIVGFVGTENTGLYGIEAYYDTVLTGTTGRVVRAKTANGTEMLFTKFEDYYDAADGSDIVLTIDTTIQNYLEKHLEQAVIDYDVLNGAAAIAMDVNTGEILGMVSLGDFDLNNYQIVSDEAQALIDAAETDEEAAALTTTALELQWHNKAIGDSYEPGSTFKILTLAMALEEGLTDEDESFYCGGSIAVAGREPVKCWKTVGHGSQTLTQAAQHSCNVAFVTLGQRIGTTTFYDYCEAFGLFNTTTDDDEALTGKTGIDIGGEMGSVWWSKNVFTHIELAAASFGQTFTITPIQLITAVSACVNGGYLMQPYVVSEVISDDGTTASKTTPTVVRQVISESTSATVCKILEQVVGDSVEGTGKNAYVAGYSIGGKTGTSIDTTVQAATGVKEYIVSFIGIAPMDDPQIAILVLLDTPSISSGIYISGGQMAAPTVGKMMADVLPYLGVSTNYTDDELEIVDKTVPNVKNLSIDEAKAQLESTGLKYRVVGDGDTVTAQMPIATAIVAVESEIVLYAGGEAVTDDVNVPSLTGMSYSAARQYLNNMGLYIRSSGGIASSSSTVYISTQSVSSGTQVVYGTVIEVTLLDEADKGRY